MGVSTIQLPILLLAISLLAVTQGQYYDILQGLQQLFQPFQQQNDYLSQYNNQQHQQRRPHNKKKSENQQHVIKNPSIQFDYIYTTTTPKPSRKSPKPNNSSHNNKQSNNNRNINSDIVFNQYPTFEVTTKKNKVTTSRTTSTVKANNRKSTTVKPNYRVTTEKVISSIIFNDRDIPNRSVTEKLFQSNGQKNVYVVNNGQTHTSLQYTRRPDNTATNVDNTSNFRQPTNNRNPNVQNINLNTQPNRFNNGGFNNAGFNNGGFNNEFIRPSNNRNPDVYATNNQNRPQNRNPNFGSTTSGFINTNDNRVTGNNFGNNFNNDRGVLNTDYVDRGNVYPNNNPLLNRPGVRPAPVDPNQAPITNKPVTDRNNYVPFDRPSNGFGTYTERPSETPEILIGPDEDDMTEGEKRRYIEISERMCDRYKSLNVKEVVALPLLPSPDPLEVNVTTCAPITVPLVIGGKIASINEFPHMALVGWRKIRDNGYSWKCGGSLISNQYILTAGHCTYQDKDYDVESGPPQAVQLGSSYLDDPRALVVKISSVIRHPKYKQRRSYYDIALIKMAHTVTFSEVIKPACLGQPPPVGDSIIATGWGRTEFGGDHSVELRSVSLPVWNMAECREIWGTSLKLPNGPTPDSHMCAGDRQGGKDTCQGDSGGPAQIQDGCVWRVVAVTSFGRSCGAANTPALYAVTKRAFIAAQVFGDQIQQDRNRYQNYG